jgi:hypothetical protein
VPAIAATTVTGQDLEIQHATGTLIMPIDVHKLLGQVPRRNGEDVLHDFEALPQPLKGQRIGLPSGRVAEGLQPLRAFLVTQAINQQSTSNLQRERRATAARMTSRRSAYVVDAPHGLHGLLQVAQRLRHL